MMDGPMTITMDLHQQILAASRDTALQEAADATQELARSSDNDVEDAFNDGLTECHDAILALRATPAPVLPAVRIAELEAAQAHNQELIAGIFSGQVREQHLEVRIVELEAARDLGVIGGDVAAQLLVVSQQARIAELEETLKWYDPSDAALSTQENTDAG
jgi:hypothetical protein